MIAFTLEATEVVHRTYCFRLCKT